MVYEDGMYLPVEVVGAVASNHRHGDVRHKVGGDLREKMQSD